MQLNFVYLAWSRCFPVLQLTIDEPIVEFDFKRVVTAQLSDYLCAWDLTTHFLAENFVFCISGRTCFQFLIIRFASLYIFVYNWSYKMWSSLSNMRFVKIKYQNLLKSFFINNSFFKQQNKSFNQAYYFALAMKMVFKVY